MNEINTANKNLESYFLLFETVGKGVLQIVFDIRNVLQGNFKITLRRDFLAEFLHAL